MMSTAAEQEEGTAALAQDEALVTAVGQGKAGAEGGRSGEKAD
eukprot:CAMPEP_0204424532 /NCGR_PEP_ID=MMETSP0470-20130426/45758_1 /ASSEMBLY_ACC=CAM_ASM_000385 /TAXON_ID=2969 /ORGANISM="Oxyrrhis marina" /LENGTH=42 /DNA_ID= /DNA_START= /DNA_END= /DNA_ORIENTATION=